MVHITFQHQPLHCDDRQIDVPMELDFILASNSLHETPDPAALLDGLFERLKPGGKVLLMDPDVAAWNREREKRLLDALKSFLAPKISVYRVQDLATATELMHQQSHTGLLNRYWRERTGAYPPKFYWEYPR